MKTGSVVLELYGKPFVHCFSLNHDFNIMREMENEACFIYVQKGTQELYSPTQKMLLNHNESVLMKCGNYISKFKNINEASLFKSVVFHLDPIVIQKAFKTTDLSFLEKKTEAKIIDPALKIEQNELLDSFISSLLPYLNYPHLAKEELLAVKLQELVYLLSESGKNVLTTQIISTLYDEETIAFEKVINTNLYNNLTVAELAHLSAKSESTFKREFNKMFGESPAKYIKRKKLEKASDLLKTSNLTISEIAWNCGFENIAHFSTSFKKKYHCSPTEFRE